MRSRLVSTMLICTAALGCDTTVRPTSSKDERDQKSDARLAASAAAVSAPEAPRADRAEYSLSKAAAQSSAMEGNATGVVSQGSGELRTGGELDPTPAMIIRTGQASVEVDSLERAAAALRQLAARVGGYVANSSFQGGREQLRSATLELKVPAQRFDDAITGLTPIGRVESVNVSAQDVGEEYVDISARVSNAHRLEDRLVSLLAARTGKLSDVLSVERELARVREEIERYEGRLRYLKTRAATSTLSVNIHERTPLIAGDPGPGPLGQAVREAWRHFVGFFAGLIESLGVLIPLALVVALVWVIVRRRLPPRRPE